MTPHENPPYLKHILDSINDIEDSIKGFSLEEFKRNKDVKDACIRRIEIIGEAAKNISKEFKEKYPKIEWAKIAGTRDVMIHAYFNVDLDIVWEIIDNDIPKLKKEISKILKDLKS